MIWEVIDVDCWLKSRSARNVRVESTKECDQADRLHSSINQIQGWTRRKEGTTGGPVW